MRLEFKRFQREHFAEYSAWFMDPELNRHLGPMDQAWLEAVLAQAESAGVTWAVFRGVELVAIVETVFDPEHRLSAAITAVATKPTCRRQGIGSTVLQEILLLHKQQGIVEHVAFISIDNPAGRACAEKAGFMPVTSQPDKQGFIEFRHRQ
jgi:RimJ/RimL family protein N-acetyltransferase